VFDCAVTVNQLSSDSPKQCIDLTTVDGKAGEAERRRLAERSARLRTERDVL